MAALHALLHSKVTFDLQASWGIMKTECEEAALEAVCPDASFDLRGLCQGPPSSPQVPISFINGGEVDCMLGCILQSMYQDNANCFELLSCRRDTVGFIKTVY